MTNISRKIAVWLEAGCDDCSEVVTYNNMSKMDFIKIIRSDGWSVGKKILCPECNKKNLSKGD